MYIKFNFYKKNLSKKKYFENVKSNDFKDFENYEIYDQPLYSSSNCNKS